MSEQERVAELERRIEELERKLNEPPMARMSGMLMTPDARGHLRSLVSQQLLLISEVSRGLAELIAHPPAQPSSEDDPGDRRNRHVPVD